MIDEKLTSKISPIQEIPEISEIDLVRRMPYQGNKIRCFHPPSLMMRWVPTAEIWRLITLFWLCLTRRPSAIIAFGIIPHGIYAWWIGKLFKIPIIQHVMGKNDLRLTFKGQSARSLALAAVKSGSFVAVRGSWTKNWLTTRGIDPNHIFVQHNVHDFNLFQPPPTREPIYDLIYVGILSPYKRLDLLFNIVAKTKQHIPTISLLVVGDGPERNNLVKLTHQLEIDSNVTFAGSQTFNSLPTYYQQARAFIMTSQGEGLPMAMIEAMSCGIPAIVPADADMEEIALDANNAIVIKQPNADNFSDAIVYLLTNNEFYQKLSRGAINIRDDCKKQFSLEYQTKVWRSVLLNTTENN
jgi:glycosyltransferase involved in cell wall biosynthesis